MSDDADLLPLFPLGVVLYPRETMPLHIFEPRYKRMIGECLDGKTPFGVVLYEKGRMAQVGCSARVVDVLRQYDDGKMDVSVIGQSRFRLEKVIDEGVYLQCEAGWMEDEEEALDAHMVQRVITQHMKLLELAGHTVRPSLYDVEHVSYTIARNAGMELEQKQQVLEAPSEGRRIALLVSHLEHLIPQVEQVEELRRKIRSNGHFEDFPSSGP